MSQKVAYVTGGMGGIGTAICQRLAREGFKVIAGCGPTRDYQRWLDEQKALGYHFYASVGNVAEWDSTVEAFAKAKAEVGPIDVLVNNAGISPPHVESMVDTTEALWDKVMDVNMKGPFFLTAEIGRRMAARGGGSVVNISTTSALMAQPEIAAYCISKAALNAMTRCFARELGPRGVRVNAISCGVIKTAMGDHTLNDPQRYADMMKINPLKRVGYPEEVAATALYLASDASSYSTGIILQVDGGVLA